MKDQARTRSAGSVRRVAAVRRDGAGQRVHGRLGVEPGQLRGRAYDLAEGGETGFVLPDIDDGEPAAGVARSISAPRSSAQSFASRFATCFSTVRGDR